MVQTQIERCQSDYQGRRCPVTLQSHVATGFLAKGLLWTNAHVLEDYLNGVAEIKNKKIAELKSDQTPIRIFIFDSSGKLVFDPYMGRAALEMVPAMNGVAIKRKTFYSEENDLLGLRLDQNIGPDLKFGVSDGHQRLYVLGYADCTGCVDHDLLLDGADSASRRPYQDSNGKGLKVTRGFELSAQQAEDFFGPSMDIFSNMAIGNMMFVSSDGRQGMSGGPILNSWGEVVGVFAGSKFKMIDDHQVRISRGVKIR